MASRSKALTSLRASWTRSWVTRQLRRRRRDRWMTFWIGLRALFMCRSYFSFSLFFCLLLLVLTLCVCVSAHPLFCCTQCRKRSRCPRPAQPNCSLSKPERQLRCRRDRSAFRRSVEQSSPAVTTSFFTPPISHKRRLVPKPVHPQQYIPVNDTLKPPCAILR